VVAPEANKNEIKKTVQDLYGVDVLKVNIIKVPGKKRRVGNHEGYKSGYKKAIVFLPKGQQIEVISR
jgi:large subunit ribosomal protein L23